MKWLCRFTHDWHVWLDIEGYRCRVCRRCWRSQRWYAWSFEHHWMDWDYRKTR